MLEKVDLADLHLSLAQFQSVDFRNDYQLGIKQLIDALPRAIRADKPVVSGPPKSKGYVFLSYAEEDAGFV